MVSVSCQEKKEKEKEKEKKWWSPRELPFFFLPSIFLSTISAMLTRVLF